MEKRTNKNKSGGLPARSTPKNLSSEHNIKVLSEQNRKDSTLSQVGEKTPKQRKQHTRKIKFKQTNLCSITGVNPPRTHGLGIWNSERVVVGIRCDKKLYQAFKPLAEQFFGSVCRPIETFMATIISTVNNNKLNNGVGVNPSLTIDIGKLVIERNIRSRRRMVVEEEKEVVEKVEVNQERVVCGCGNLAEFKVFINDSQSSEGLKPVFLCRGCLKNVPSLQLVGHRRLEPSELSSRGGS